MNGSIEVRNAGLSVEATVRAMDHEGCISNMRMSPAEAHALGKALILAALKAGFQPKEIE